jgi:hypothetical protein
MFNDSKYTTWYYQIINNAKQRIVDFGKNRHHIVPKCMGGSNDLSNLIDLTYREHFICHRLLIKMVEPKFKSKMVYAAWQQSRSAKLKGTRITSRTFAKLKEELSQSYTGRKRIAFSEEWKNNMAESKKGIKNHMFNKHHKAESLEKMSANRIGKCVGEDNPFFKKTHSPEVIANIIKSNTTIHACPHCGKSGKSNSMKRWHFDNCKFRR